MLLCCLRRNVEASCHILRRRLPPSTITAAYQRLVSSTRHGPSQLSVLHLAFTAHDGARYWLRIAISAYPTRIRLPRWGRGSRRNDAMTFGMKKLEWFGYPIVNKFWSYDYSFWQNSRTWRTDRRTHGRTQHDGIGRVCVASRGKKWATDTHPLT